MGVWPENMPAVSAFSGLLTQWRIGMAGATGLDYSAIPFVLEMGGVARIDWPQVFDDIRVMEVEALNCMREQRKERNGN